MTCCVSLSPTPTTATSRPPVTDTDPEGSIMLVGHRCFIGELVQLGRIPKHTTHFCPPTPTGDAMKDDTNQMAGAVALISIALLLVAGCSGSGSQGSRAVARTTISTPTSTPSTPSPDPSVGSEVAGETVNPCLSAERLFVKQLVKRWSGTASAPMNSPVQQMAALGWSEIYLSGSKVLRQHGCGNPPPNLAKLDQAAGQLSSDLLAANLMDFSVPDITSALKQTSSDLEVTTASASLTCKDLHAVAADLVVASQSGTAGDELWPRLTLRNPTTHRVVVSYRGNGSVPDPYSPGNPLKMDWSYDAPVILAAGQTRVINVGLATGETIFAPDGQRASVQMHVFAGTPDHLVDRCPVVVHHLD